MKSLRVLAISALLVFQTATPATAIDSSVVGRPISPYQTAAGAGTVAIAWQAPVQNAEAVDGYKVQYRSPGSTEWVTYVNKTTGTSLDVTGLSSPGVFEMRIAAVNGNFTSPYVIVKSDVDQKTATQITTGGYNTCALLDDATVECWGYNWAQTLGDNVSLESEVLTPIKPYNLSNVTKISSGSTHHCALKGNGTVWCWGANIFGELGDGTNYYTKKPNIVPGITNAIDIDVNYSTSCAVLADRTVQCWGLNNGKIFSDNSEKNLSPRTVPNLSDVKKISLGRSFNCALLMNDDLKCWGDNSIGQMGVGYISPENATYISATIASGVKDFAIGSTNACYLDFNNNYYCWGSNNYGQVGDDSGRPVLSPKLILTDVRKIPENIGYHQCVSMIDMSVKCWGWNPHDALGVGDNIRHDAPMYASEVSDDQYSQIEVGYLHTCTLSESSGVVQCWGANDKGQLGNGQGGAPSSEGNFGPAVGYQYQYVRTADRPENISFIAQSGKARDYINVGWHAPFDNYSPITQYNIRYTFDDIEQVPSEQVVWNNATSAEPQFIIQNVEEARAAYITVNAENAVGTSSWTDPIVVTSSGTREITGIINAWDDVPVFGGSLSWSTQDGGFASSKPIGLTAYGTIKFPRVPAGNLHMVFNEIQTQEGAVVTGSADIYIGFNQTKINLPNPQSQSRWAIQVSSPDGAVPNANVNVTGLTTTVYKGGFKFEVPELINSGLTNADGMFFALGFSNGSSTVSVRYDDGILVQNKTAFLNSDVTYIELEEMPWINIYDDMVDAYKDQLVSITMNVNDTAPLSIRHNVAPLTSSGILISVKPPKGATQKNCGAKLSGRTNQAGFVTRKFALPNLANTKSRGEGAITNKAVTLKVAGTDALEVKNLQAISPELGVAEISWNKPDYLGGKKLKYYQIIIKGNGKTKLFTTKYTSHTISDLANATKYEIEVRAVTALGAGKVAKTTVPIA